MEHKDPIPRTLPPPKTKRRKNSVEIPTVAYSTESVAKAVAFVRAAAGLKQSDVHRHLGISSTMQVFIERGERNIPPKRLKALLERLGLAPRDFFHICQALERPFGVSDDERLGKIVRNLLTKGKRKWLTWTKSEKNSSEGSELSARN